MTSDSRVYVWVFPPGESDPVVAGVIAPSSTSNGLAFQYGRSYVDGSGASLGPDLPVARGIAYPPVPELGMPFTIRDAMPDNWGRQVINRQLGVDLEDQLSDVRYMLESGSDRVGAVDFQASSAEYVPRVGGGTLMAVSEGAAAIETGSPIGSDLFRAVRNTLTAAGGSQPKAYVEMNGRCWLAKFTTDYDKVSPLIKSERAALYIARKAGIDVPEADLIDVGGRGLALLTERFDRVGTARRMVLSGNTISGYAGASGGSYPVLVERLRRLSRRPGEVGPELFRRLAFRMAMRIDDDHLRNIAVFWDGEYAEFTPAFDLSPDLTGTPHGLTDIGDGSRAFNLEELVKRHRYYHLTRAEATDWAVQMVDAVRAHRSDAAEVAQMTESEKQQLLTRTAVAETIGSLANHSIASVRSGQDRTRRGALGLGGTKGGGNRGSFVDRQHSQPETAFGSE